MLTASVLIGLSVLMHVTWNLLARHVAARCNYLWWGLLVHLVLLGPVGAYGLWQDARWSWTLLAATVVTMLMNSLYFIGLREAYARAPATYVYPLARSSPLLILLWEWLLWSSQPGKLALLGLLISVAGLWLLGNTARSHAATRSALPWIGLAALATSLYSLSDKVAVSALPSLPALLGFVSLGYLAAFVVLSWMNYRQTARTVPACRPEWRYLLPGGLFIGTAYALVIQSMQYLPAAYVVAFTNAGIVLASLLAVLVLNEKEAWQQRLLAAGLIALGLLVLGVAQYWGAGSKSLL